MQLMNSDRMVVTQHKADMTKLYLTRRAILAFRARTEPYDRQLAITTAPIDPGQDYEGDRCQEALRPTLELMEFAKAVDPEGYSINRYFFTVVWLDPSSGRTGGG